MRDLKDLLLEAGRTKDPHDFSEFETVYYDIEGQLATPWGTYQQVHFYVRPSKNGAGWSYFGNTKGLSKYKWVNMQHTVPYSEIPDNILDEIRTHSGQIYCEFPDRLNTDNVTFDDVIKYFVPEKKIKRD